MGRLRVVLGTLPPTDRKGSHAEGGSHFSLAEAHHFPAPDQAGPPAGRTSQSHRSPSTLQVAGSSSIDPDSSPTRKHVRGFCGSSVVVLYQQRSIMRPARHVGLLRTLNWTPSTLPGRRGAGETLTARGPRQCIRPDRMLIVVVSRDEVSETCLSSRGWLPESYRS